MKRTFLKKSNVTKALAALAMTASFGIMASCTDYSEFSEEDLKHQQDLKSYTEMFEAMFGKMDPNHTWGMKDEMKPMLGLSTMGTRAGSVIVNRNQWTECTAMENYTLPTYGGNSANKYTFQVPVFRNTDGVLGHDIQIPGWPHLNGLYYASEGNVLGAVYDCRGNYRDRDGVTKSGASLSGKIPAGDVTPYEIQYVSAWFRTHKIGDAEFERNRVNLHLSDFFIQNVSCDFDQTEYTELSTPYASGWPQTGKNGKNIATKEEALAPTKKDKDGNVYAENLTENINYDLDDLGFCDMKGDWTHVNNFNRQNSNFSPEDFESTPNREIKYIKSSGTEDFHCRPSWATGAQGDETGTYSGYIKTWVLIHLTWTETVKDELSPYPVGTAIPREGYYLAFDFHAKKDGHQIVHQDGYYSNWIIKITPGHFAPTSDAKRIMCEDLGGALDFDFNDAVVDVGYEQVAGGYQAIVAVQATGATMPIKIEVNDDDHEIHNLLGHKNEYKQINVDDTKFTHHTTAIFRGGTYAKAIPGNIKFWVTNTKVTPNITYSVTDDFPSDDSNDRHNLGNDDNPYGTPTIDPVTGRPTYTGGDTGNTGKQAPRAFAVPNTNVKWMKEYIPIDNCYTQFHNWVADKDWKQEGTDESWYMITADAANKLYTPTWTPTGPTGGGGSGDNISWVDLTPDPEAEDIVAGVKADGYMKLNGYTGADAIVTKLNTMSNDGRIVFSIIMSSNTNYDASTLAKTIQGVMIPADIDGTAMKHNNTTFALENVKQLHNAVGVPGHTEAGFGTYTYTLQFSFAKSDILRSETSTYHDYILFFLKVGEYALGTGKHDITIHKYYVHY